MGVPSGALTDTDLMSPSPSSHPGALVAAIDVIRSPTNVRHVRGHAGPRTGPTHRTREATSLSAVFDKWVLYDASAKPVKCVVCVGTTKPNLSVTWA